MSLLELAEARNIIETATAELAAKRASKKDIEAMRAAVAEAAEALEEDNKHFMPHTAKLLRRQLTVESPKEFCGQWRFRLRTDN